MAKCDTKYCSVLKTVPTTWTAKDEKLKQEYIATRGDLDE